MPNPGVCQYSIFLFVRLKRCCNAIWQIPYLVTYSHFKPWDYHAFWSTLAGLFLLLLLISLLSFTTHQRTRQRARVIKAPAFLLWVCENVEQQISCLALRMIKTKWILWSQREQALGVGRGGEGGRRNIRGEHMLVEQPCSRGQVSPSSTQDGYDESISQHEAWPCNQRLVYSGLFVYSEIYST